MKTFEPHQNEALAYALKTPHPALFMDLRMGKAVVMLRLIREARLKKVLWLTKRSAFSSFQADADDEGLFWRDYTLMAPTRREANMIEMFESPRQEIALATHTQLLTSRYIGRFPWDMVVFDESVALKNPQSQITKYSLKNFRDAKRRAILTGLPDPEDTLDYFGQFAFLYGMCMGVSDYWRFRNKYYDSVPWNAYEWKPKPGFLSDLTGYVHEKAYVKRRRDIRKIEEKQYSVLSVPPSPEQTRILQQVEKELSYMSETEGEVETNYPMVAAGWSHRIAGGFTPEGRPLTPNPKLGLLLSLIERGGELFRKQVVVWCRYQDEVHLIVDTLQAEGISTQWITGELKQEDRNKAEFSFQRGESTVLVATIASCAKGANFSASDYEIFYSSEWSNDLRTQSEDRIVSLRKNYPVGVIDLVLEDTIDEVVIQAVKEKKLSSEMVMSGWLAKMKGKL